jgi:hypothetical protein
MSERDRFRFGFAESYDICNLESISPILPHGGELTSIDHLLDDASDYRVHRYHRYDPFNRDLSCMIAPTVLELSRMYHSTYTQQCIPY